MASEEPTVTAASVASRSTAPSPPRGQVDLNPGGRTQFMNMGLWAQARTLDEAGEAMARWVARAAKLGAGDRLLDVGCGRGEAAFLWAAEYGVERIVAVDADPDHIAGAHRRAATQPVLAERVEFRVGSAVDLRVGAGSFDKVVCVEASHAFASREAFMAEAFRALRDGGLLVIADMLPLPGRDVRHFAMRPENAYARDVLAQKLEQAGFVNVVVESRREQVIEPFNRHLSRLPSSRGLRGRLRMYRLRKLSASLDYVFATATKPH
jgi:erythromycin 3''-O-methyltransferase